MKAWDGYLFIERTARKKRKISIKIEDFKLR